MQYVSPDYEMTVTGKHIQLPWNTIEAMCKEIRHQFTKDMWLPKRLLALGRGAMVPSRVLAVEHTPIYFLGIQSYKGQKQHDINCYQDIETCDTAMLNQPNTLIVDDLWDTGQTFEKARDRFPKAKTAALLSKKKEHGLTYCGLVFPTEAWVVFPWE